MVLVPLPRFAPDQSNFNPNASRLIKNARPTKDGWGPLKDLVGVGEALPSAPRGAIAVKSDAGVSKIFAGTATNLYNIQTTDYVPQEISRATDDYNLPDVVFWSYARFGNNLIATAVGSTFPQFVDIETANNFANLTNASFEAEIVAVVGDFVVFARIDGDKRTLRWSGVNDMTFWTNGQRGADEQQLPDGGAIMAVIPQAQNALIIQENTIRQMIFDPSSGLTFRFEVLDPARGAFARRSVVNIGPGDFVYLAKDGFYRGIQAQPIGAERVDRFIFAECDPDKYDLISGVADPFEKVVHFRYEDTGGTNHLLSYDWQLNEWFPTEVDAVDFLEAATAGYTLDELDAFGTLDSLPYSLDSRFWKGGIPGFAGFTADFKFGFFDGDTLEALIETEDKALSYPRRAITDRTIILADTDAAELAIAAKETQNGALSFGSFVSMENGNPTIAKQVSGRWHRFRIKVPAGTTWTNAVGVDVTHVDGGLW